MCEYMVCVSVSECLCVSVFVVAQPSIHRVTVREFRV